jgi:AraC-like DNA-binding protein
MTNCTCTPYEECTYCFDVFYEEKKRVKRARNKRRRQNRKAKEAAQRVRENEINDHLLLELWARQSGLKYETLKDLIGLNF